jgi:hypothetical protein
MSFWERFTGKAVAAAGLGQKKRAVVTGIAAFDGPIGDLRLEIAIKSHPWLQNSATTTLLLSVWTAQALQDMAAVLEATAQKHLGEVGMLPEATFALADELYYGALGWIEHAQTALAAVDADPEFELAVELPAKAPRLDWVVGAQPAHFVATIHAVVQLGTSVEDALNNMQDDRSRLPRKYDDAFKVIVGVTKVARAKLDQVEAAESDRQAVRLSREIWAMLQEVVRLYFMAGQQIARPALIDPRYDAVAQAAARSRRLPPPPAPPPAPASSRTAGPPPASSRTAGPPPTGPGRAPVQVGQGYVPRTTSHPASPPAPPPPAVPTLGQRLGLTFDAWGLTDPSAKSVYRNDPARIAELEAFWRADTNPEETYRLFGRIVAAVKAGQVAVRPGEFSKACPWISTFVARVDVAIGTERFRTGQLFNLKAGAEGNYFGRGFDRLGFIPGAQQAKPKPKPVEAPSPSRIDSRYDRDRKPRTSRATPVPTIPSGEDMWCLTAAFQRPQRRANPADAEELRQLWRADPDPGRTIQFHEELMAAVRAGNARQNGDEGLRECPWGQVYVAMNRVTIGGVQLERNEKFAFQVNLTDGKFTRGIRRLGSIRSGA